MTVWCTLERLGSLGLLRLLSVALLTTLPVGSLMVLLQLARPVGSLMVLLQFALPVGSLRVMSQIACCCGCWRERLQGWVSSYPDLVVDFLFQA